MAKIEFIIPTYNRPNHLMCTINSIVSQRSDKWYIHVIADCPPNNSLDKIINYFEGDERIKFTILEERYNDWGHTPRNIGLDKAKEDWVIMTGEDNYYAPVFVDHFLDGSEKYDFVYCDMIHNWTDSQYHHIKCKPKLYNIDIGCFMVRRNKLNGLRLDTTKTESDGLFVEEYLKINKNSKIKYIEKPLYVHN